jgi:tetraacyldisaccharide 4'-kinase
VAVGEERLEAIPQLLHDKPETMAIILDDAFQHRRIRAGLNILLTDYQNLFTRDFYLPTGDLRDQKMSYKRAQIIVVTKCKKGLSPEEKKKLHKEINPLPTQKLFFTSIEYGHLYHITRHETYYTNPTTEILLVTGVANPEPLKKMLEEHHNSYQMMQYPDHHIFRIDDLKEISKKFQSISAPEKIILTTEKDAVRLVKFNHQLADLPLYILPVRHSFLFGEEEEFKMLVTDFIQNFKQSN